jgi:hypothetical protein
MLRQLFSLGLNLVFFARVFMEYVLFFANLYNLESTQKNVLFGILRKNKNSEFGKKYSFSSIKDIEDFQARVPLSSYADYAPGLDMVLKGKKNVLTSQEVFLCVPSSGSTSASKYIPYTRSLKDEFRKGLYAWVFDLFRHRPGLLWGKHYWSISPAGCSHKKNSKIKIGFDDDSEYFGFLGKYALRRFLAVPAEVARIEDTDTFRYVTLLFLLRERNLVFISIWNPSFFTLILDFFHRYSRLLLEDIRKGTISFSGKIPHELKGRLMRKLSKNDRRADELEMILKQYERKEGFLYEKIWPHLCLISCWADGTAGSSLRKLQSRFPNTLIQPKGLIATEGIVSFPLVGEEAGVLSFRSHFFEFRTVGSGNSNGRTVKRVGQLKKGERYEVVLTTGGGLYRYCLGDIVEVVGFKGTCPRIRFIGKGDNVSDLFGEKLNGVHVKAVLDKALGQLKLRPEFTLLAPEKSNGSYAYTFFVKFDAPEDKKLFIDRSAELAYNIETGLRDNFNYRYCRKLGQLKPVRVFVIEDDPQEKYFRQCLRTQVLGNIKNPVVSRLEGWSGVFKGYFLEGGGR